MPTNQINLDSLLKNVNTLITSLVLVGIIWVGNSVSELRMAQAVAEQKMIQINFALDELRAGRRDFDIEIMRRMDRIEQTVEGLVRQ